MGFEWSLNGGFNFHAALNWGVRSNWLIDMHLESKRMTKLVKDIFINQRQQVSLNLCPGKSKVNGSEADTMLL